MDYEKGTPDGARAGTGAGAGGDGVRGGEGCSGQDTGSARYAADKARPWRTISRCGVGGVATFVTVGAPPPPTHSLHGAPGRPGATRGGKGSQSPPLILPPPPPSVLVRRNLIVIQ